MALAYTQLVIDHFKNPRNVGEIENPDAEAMLGSPACGDMLHMSMRVDANTRVITGIRFRSYGCASSISTASMVTEMIKGKTIDVAKKTTWVEVIEALGGLPPIKVHCSILAIDTMHDAIHSWQVANGEEKPKRLDLTAKNIREVLGHIVYGGTGETITDAKLLTRVKVHKDTKNIDIYLAISNTDIWLANLTDEILEHIQNHFPKAQKTTIMSKN